MPAYAHTHPDFPGDPTQWEPLFTPFGESANEYQREHCEKRRTLEPYHGHLNKVAFWTAKFASEMVAPNSPAATSAYDLGYARENSPCQNFGLQIADWKKSRPHPKSCPMFFSSAKFLRFLRPVSRPTGLLLDLGKK